MVGIDKVDEAMIAVMRSHGIIAHGSVSPRALKILCLFYDVEEGNSEALYKAMREFGDPSQRLKQLRIAGRKSRTPPTLKELLDALDEGKVIFKRTAPGRPKKWDELGPKLLARVEEIKGRASNQLSDEDAVWAMIKADPGLLKIFCEESTWAPLLNPKNKLKDGADIGPVARTLENQLVEARRQFK